MPVKRQRMKCGGCGRLVSSLHDISERWIRDLPDLDARTWLLFWRRRVRCPACGPKLEEASWLGRYARVTKRLAQSVGRLSEVTSIKYVVQFFNLSWWTVKSIDKRYLAEKLDSVSLRNIDVIAMDEFAIQKGHRYATVVVEPCTKQVLWIGRGRSRESIRPFFRLLGKDDCKRLKAEAMDINGAYEAEVKAHCPQAEIVYDFFHVEVKYGSEIIDLNRAIRALPKRSRDKTWALQHEMAPMRARV